MLKCVIIAVFLAVTSAQRSAVVYLFDPSGTSGVTGNVTFEQSGNELRISGAVIGLTEGEHGFHIHEKGHIAPGCTGTGGHFNPKGQHHGAPKDSVRHVGDLGNIVANAQGVANINFQDKIIALDGENCIVGRAVVVHALRDDLGKGGNADSLITGNAGGRVACGVIGIQSSGTIGQISIALLVSLIWALYLIH